MSLTSTPVRSPRRLLRLSLALLTAALALGMLAIAVTVRGRGAPGRSTAPLRDALTGPLAGVLAALPTGTATLDAEGSRLIIELPAIDLPPGGPGAAVTMATSPLVGIRLPADGYISGFRVEIRNAAGQVLPQAFLHHVNLYDPSRRELFAPIQLHLFASGRETPAVSVPRLLFGIPVEQGQLVTAKAMVGNETPEAVPGVTVRLVATFTSVHPIWPLFRTYPWVMDVLFPIGRQPGGSKAFDLPPGVSSRSWVSSPAIAGTIVGMAGHVHDHVKSLTFTDSTTGEVLWRGAPVTSDAGQVISLPATRFASWNRLGVHITPTHRYQVTVVYENPTAENIVDGGMGAVAGAFVPDRGTLWPAVDPTNPEYARYLLDIIALPAGSTEMMGTHHH